MTLDAIGLQGTSRFSGQRGRTADGTTSSGVRYPNPFFDIGHTFLPTSLKSLLRWCRFYFLTNPLINSVIFKMSEYPITEIVIDERNAEQKERWEEVLFRHLRYRAFQIETGLDYYTYGIAAVTIHFPFTKWLVCRHCKFKEKATKLSYKWRNLEYILDCPKCGAIAPALVQDFNERDVRRIRLQRWNPEYIHIDPGFGGAEPIYTFQLPVQLRNDIIIGKKNVLDTVPDVFIEAMKRNKFIRFTDDNIFVFKRPVISQNEDGWGMPLPFPVLKDTFYLQILRKAQEAIAQEHIVPLRVLFPQAGSGTSDPYTTISLDSWRFRMEQEISKWKYDSNYIPILPLPIGQESIGGDGRALMLHQEMRAWSEQIIAGMGVPQEFVFGGLQYSGSNVSMRMLENAFIGYRTDHENMLNNFVIRRIANYMGWPTVKAHMRRFKMADDLQRVSLYFNMFQAQVVSKETLQQEADLDPVVEGQRMQTELEGTIQFQRKQQIAQANLQADVQRIQMKVQLEGQEQALAAQANAQAAAGGVPGDPGAAPQPGAGEGVPQDPNAPMDPNTPQQGEMVPGPQVDPAMPENSTVSPEDASGQLPAEVGSPLTMGQRGGGANLIYLAGRAVAALEKEDPMTQQSTLSKMQATNPQLYMLVIQKMRDRKGSQEDPLNAMQSPLPQQRPSRRAAPVGA